MINQNDIGDLDPKRALKVALTFELAIAESIEAYRPTMGESPKGLPQISDEDILRTATMRVAAHIALEGGLHDIALATYALNYMKDELAEVRGIMKILESAGNN